MFRFTLKEANTLLALRSQNAILKRVQHIKYSPNAFTEQG